MTTRRQGCLAGTAIWLLSLCMMVVVYGFLNMRHSDTYYEQPSDWIFRLIFWGLIVLSTAIYARFLYRKFKKPKGG